MSRNAHSSNSHLGIVRRAASDCCGAILFACLGHDAPLLQDCRKQPCCVLAHNPHSCFFLLARSCQYSSPHTKSTRFVAGCKPEPQVLAEAPLMLCPLHKHQVYCPLGRQCQPLSLARAHRYKLHSSCPRTSCPQSKGAYRNMLSPGRQHRPHLQVLLTRHWRWLAR